MIINAWAILIASKHILIRRFGNKLALPGLAVQSAESAKKELQDYMLNECGVEIEIPGAGWEFDAGETKDIFFISTILGGSLDAQKVAWVNIPTFNNATVLQVEDLPVIEYISNALSTMERS